MTIDDLFKWAAESGCSAPGCTEKHGPIYLHAQCHPRADVEVSVDAGAGKMYITCAICEQQIVTISHTMTN